MRNRKIIKTSLIISVLFTGMSLFSTTTYARHKRHSHHSHHSVKHHQKIAVKHHKRKAKHSHEVAATSPKMVQKESDNNSNVNPHVMSLALKAYNNALQRGFIKQKVLTIIDYSLPSSVKRMWVLDILSKKVLYHTLVAHGKHTGGLFAKHFSDKPGSRASSIGTFVTENTYFGTKGYSLRLRGLEPGFNDLAHSRAIVLHGAWYATQDFARQHGRLGLSWGCPAVAPYLARPIINQIKNGTLVFAYYPDSRWLHKSKFVGVG
jgi:hypothetical protein